MSYESTAEPVKIGYIMDFILPDEYPQDMRKDLTDPFDLVFNEARERGVIDRPLEIIYREVEGLPKGSVKAVIDAYGELVDEGCLAVFGPQPLHTLTEPRDRRRPPHTLRDHLRRQLRIVVEQHIHMRPRSRLERRERRQRLAALITRREIRLQRPHDRRSGDS